MPPSFRIGKGGNFTLPIAYKASKVKHEKHNGYSCFQTISICMM
jgi:hypothetical protein